MAWFNLLFVIAIVGCNYQHSNNKTAYTTPDETETILVEGEIFAIQDMEIGYDNLKLISELEKKTKSVSDKEMTNTGCKDWIFDKENLKEILTYFKKVEAVEWNAICYNYPCYYEGKVSNGEKEYTIIINAASYIQLVNEEESLYFVQTDESKIFLIPCNCCE